MDHLLNDCSAQCLTLYGSFTSGDWLLCHQQLCNFFKGRKIRVSIFLQTGLQTADGTLLTNGAGPLPEGTDLPGTLRQFSLNGRLESTSMITHPLAAECVVDGDHGAAIARELGSSMYRRTDGAYQHTRSPSSNADAKPTTVATLSRRSTAKDELDLLSDLLGDESSTASQETLTLEFLDGSSRDLKNAVVERSEAKMVLLDGTAARKSARDMMNDLDLGAKDESKKSGDRKADASDLLDLLDESK